jgi:hypothetical protein
MMNLYKYKGKPFVDFFPEDLSKNMAEVTLSDIQAYLSERGLVAVEADAGKLAEKFHDIYERLAPDFSYETRKSSAVPWCDVPNNNKNLMIATCIELIAAQGKGDEQTG